MSLQSLTLGNQITLLAGIIYALPAKKVRLTTSAAAPTLTISTDPAFGTNVALVLTAGEVELAGGFIKAAADTPVIVKPA